MDETGLLNILRWPGTPLWAIALMAGVMAFKTWPYILERWNERLRDRATERAGDWKRLREEIARLCDRCERLEARDEECRTNLLAVREDLAAERGERMKLQAIIDGMGEIRQAAANAAAEVRLDAQAEKDRKRP